jgi:hypothetical protein
VGVYVRPYPTLCPFSHHSPDIFSVFLFSPPHLQQKNQVTTEKSGNKRELHILSTRYLRRLQIFDKNERKIPRKVSSNINVPQKFMQTNMN